MRLIHIICALAVSSFAQVAAAAPIALTPVHFSAAFQQRLDRDLGTREGVYLQREVATSVSRALERSGAQLAPSAPLTLDITLVDAQPNKPTFRQLTQNVSLDYVHSSSLGGAKLTGVLRDGDRVVATITHDAHDIIFDEFVVNSSTWTAARRAIDGFAAKVARAYVDNSSQN